MPGEVIPRIGWMPLWSEDRKTLVQVFTDLDTGLIQLVSVTSRQRGGDWWGPTIEVREEWANDSYAP